MGLEGLFNRQLAIGKEYVWIGTDNGLSRYDKKTGKIDNFTKNDGLADNDVSAVAVDGDFIWVGTKWSGISRYDKTVNTWQTFNIMNGLIDNTINCIAAEGEFVWVGNNTGLSYYDKIYGMWGGYDTSMGLQEGNIRSIEVAGQYLWLGTVNGLIQYDKYEETFKLYTTTDGLADDYIQKLRLDGLYLWIGTFSGVTRYNVLKGDWYTYTEKDGLIENSVNCLEVDGNYIWFGTDGSGISIFDKEIPQASISPFSYYDKPGNLSLMGTAFDYDGIGSYKIEYKNEAMKEYVFAGMNILKQDNVIQDKLANWDVSQLFNINYDVRLTVVDKKGSKNIAIDSIQVDTTPPELTLNLLPEAVKESAFFIKGTYFDNNITRILISVNEKTKEKTDLNRLLKTYSKEINLDKGINTINITAYDIADLSTAIKAEIVYDKEKPVLTLKPYPKQAPERKVLLQGDIVDSGIQRVVLNPGNIEITFTRNEDNTFSLEQEVELGTGFNKFEITAYDFVGNKAVENPVIEYTSSAPFVVIDKNILRTAEPDFEIKGTWGGDEIDYIMIEELKQNAQMDFDKKTFSLKTKLKKGENIITANIFNKDGNKSFDVTTILYTTEKSAIDFVNLPGYTFQKSLTLNGIYNEPNLDKIILNPGKITVSVDSKNMTFSFNVDLNEGGNEYEIAMTDKFGLKSTKKFNIVYDGVIPSIILNNVPTTVYAKDLEISGKFEEENMEAVTIKPGDIKCKVSEEYKTFSGTMSLKEGKNELRIIAMDRAGNSILESREVTYIPKAVTVAEKGEIDSEYVQELKNEIARLKKLLKSSQPVTGTVVYRDREKKFSLPKKNGLALVPFSRLKVDSLFEVSKKYLGNYMYIDFINKYNNTGKIDENNNILLPTKKFIKEYVRIESRQIKDILDIIAISYKLSGKSHSKFKQKLAFNLFKKDIIDKNGFNFLIKNNYIKEKDFLI